MHSLDAYAQDKLASLRERHLYRALNETLREDGIWVERHDPVSYTHLTLPTNREV